MTNYGPISCNDEIVDHCMPTDKNIIKLSPDENSRVPELLICNTKQEIFSSNKNGEKILTLFEKPLYFGEDTNKICRIKFQDNDSIENLILELQNLLTIY